MRAPLGSLGRRHAVVALVLYVAAALVFQRHAVAHIGSTCACWGTDASQFMWAMTWWPHALVSGMNPFVTHVMWVPDQVNLASATTTPGPALFAAPLTALAGPVVSYNVLMVLAPITGAWFAYRLCLYLTRAPAASILGGYLFGFSTYGLGQLEGHLQLVFTFAAPAAALLTLKRLDGVIGARRYLVLMAIVLVAQLLCGTEMLLTLTCMGVVALAAGWLFSAAQTRPRIIALLAPLAGAYAVLVVLCAPFLYYALTGPNVIGGTATLYPADALSFVIPPVITLAGGHRFAAVSGSFAGNFAENGTYLGIPLVLVVAAFAIKRWRTGAGKILLSVLAVAVAWALGETLHIDGHATIPLPWRAFAGLPLLHEVLPVRIGVYIALVSAVMAALWLATPGSRLLRWLLAAVAVAFLIPNANAVAPTTGANLFNESFDVPTFFSTNLYRRYLRPGEIVLPIPLGMTGPSLVWQARTDMYFRLASGGFELPADYASNPFVEQALGSRPVAAPEAALRSFIRERRVSAVVVEANMAGAWPGVLARLGLRVLDTGGVLLYRIHARY
jgi:hypothetical protein